MCYKWSSCTYPFRRQLQQLTGKRSYIHCCVCPAPLFINRILGLLRNTPAKGTIKLPQSFFQKHCLVSKKLKNF